MKLCVDVSVGGSNGVMGMWKGNVGGGVQHGAITDGCLLLNKNIILILRHRPLFLLFSLEVKGKDEMFIFKIQEIHFLVALSNIQSKSVNFVLANAVYN